MRVAGSGVLVGGTRVSVGGSIVLVAGTAVRAGVRVGTTTTGSDVGEGVAVTKVCVVLVGTGERPDADVVGVVSIAGMTSVVGSSAIGGGVTVGCLLARIPMVGVGAEATAAIASSSAVGTLPTTTGVGVTVSAALAVARSVAIKAGTRGASGGSAPSISHGA